MEPQPRLGLAALTRLAYSGADLHLLESELAAQYAGGTASASTLMDLSVITQLLGHAEQGLYWQSLALDACRVYRTHRTGPARRRVLVYAAPIHMGGNTPIEFLLPGDTFDIVTYYLGSETPARDAYRLPPHDVAFCAMPADAENAEAAWETVRFMSRNSGVQVLNLPETLIKPERDTLPDLLQDVPGVHVPRTLRLGRDTLCAMLRDGTGSGLLDAAIGTYPFVCRPVGSHAGLGLEKIDTPADFQAYLNRRDEAEFYVSEFIDYATRSDGRFRKFRVVVIGGQAFACHMAIADQWDVWYLNSDMSASEDKRREEAQFMQSFPEAFGARHAAAFDAMAERLGLDYFGLDCTEDAEGNLVVFEVDNALIVHDMDCKTTFPYKEAHMQKLFAAFEGMLEAHCPPEAQHFGPVLPDEASVTASRTAALPGSSPVRAGPARRRVS
ncbi:hypothetical protein [uncultured Roseobacter sp.]|uniref:ATP-grasp domain-containing protein n=1 Tax=uncultured Roseobacter sp. TaxID=114847 RepID=UPI00260CE597|nr:hypothetical protein [uncultured Roseobacter sp.]